MAYWPVTLPQKPLAGSLSFQDQDNVLRGPADVGEPTRRRRYTAASRMLSFSVVLNAAQLAILDTFYHTTLGGVDRFTWADPVSGTEKEFAFAAPCQVQHMVAVDCFSVAVTLIRQAE